jgi:hypothetical protein
MAMRRFAPTRPIEVVTRRGGDEPCALRWRGRTERVAEVEAAWEMAAGWWRTHPEATRRHYYRLRAASGLLCIVYRDLDSGRWFLEQISD